MYEHPDEFEIWGWLISASPVFSFIRLEVCMESILRNLTSLSLSVSTVRICIFSDINLQMLPGTAAFSCADDRIVQESRDSCAAAGVPEAQVLPAVMGGSKNTGGVTVPVYLQFVDRLPAEEGAPCGEDDIFSFYREGIRFFQLARPGVDGSISLAVYPEDFRSITLYVNEGTFPGVVRTADKVLQLLPMKQLLSHFRVFLLHSSRISVNGRAILFTAPSQTGKTTQARLWQEHAGAGIAGNDRTLLWEENGTILTGGYPVDGSSPVYSSARIPLGAIAVLRQSPENRAVRLSAAQALRFLMEQTALDAWNTEERVAAQLFWLDLMEYCPVYQLECRPDADAVRCLKDRLEKDEVISGVFDS